MNNRTTIILDEMREDWFSLPCSRNNAGNRYSESSAKEDSEATFFNIYTPKGTMLLHILRVVCHLQL